MISRRRREPLRHKLLLAAFSALVCAVGAEAAVRFAGETDLDGNFSFLGRRVRPYALPLRALEAKVEEYSSAPDSFFAYDPDLGWTLRPGQQSRIKPHHLSNRSGLRGPSRDQVVAKLPRDGVLRLAIFGDSYAFGADVPYAQSWGHVLEQSLRARGISVEVLNFGVGGYGTDQAYLRWEKEGRGYAPDVVLMGFCVENMRRNTNLVRPLYVPTTDLPFSKPRFVLQGGSLRLVNVPAVPPQDLVATLRDLESWDLAAYETAIDREDYARRWWHRSRIVSLLVDRRRERRPPVADPSDPAGEPARVTLGVIARFAASVRGTGARFAAVYLPWEPETAQRMAGSQPSSDAILERIRGMAELIDPSDALVAVGQRSGLAALYAGHYSAEGNRVVGETVAAALAQDRLPKPPARR